MKAKEKSKIIIEKLKKVKEEKGITYQEISDMTAENNEYVSVSTIKNIFSEKDKHDHDYAKTIMPVARALIGNLENENNIEAESYAAINDYKNVVIEKLEQRIIELKAQKESSSKKHKDRELFLMEQLDFYKEQIQFKDSQIKRLTANIDRKDAMIKKLLIKEE